MNTTSSLSHMLRSLLIHSLTEHTKIFPVGDVLLYDEKNQITGTLSITDKGRKGTLKANGKERIFEYDEIDKKYYTTCEACKGINKRKYLQLKLKNHQLPQSGFDIVYEELSDEAKERYIGVMTKTNTASIPLLYDFLVGGGPTNKRQVVDPSTGKPPSREEIYNWKQGDVNICHVCQEVRYIKI